MLNLKGWACQPKGKRRWEISCERWQLQLQACEGCNRGEGIRFRWLNPLQLRPFPFPAGQAACGYTGGSSTVCQFVFLDQFLRFLLCLCFFVFVYFFILVHHPGSKIKRSDSSSSISSQSPIGWLLSFVPLTHTPAH